MKSNPAGNTELPDLPLHCVAPLPEGDLELPDEFRLVDDGAAAQARPQAVDDHAAREHFLTFRDALKHNNKDRALRNLRTAIRLDPNSFEPVPSAKYRIDDIEESDRSCVVFRCTDLSSDARVLVRTYGELTPEQGERFFELEKKFRKLNDPRIVPPAVFGTLGGPGKRRAYLIDGSSDWPQLDHDIFEQGALTAKQLIAFAGVLVDTLIAAHDESLFHGALNPAKVHIRKEGKQWQIRLVGLGLAPLLGRPTNDSDYVAPELRSIRSRTDIDATAEVFSFGKVCLFALFGNPNPSPVEWEEVPKPLTDFLIDCTRPDPRERLQNFDEVARDLIRKGEALSAPISKKSKAPRQTSPSPRSPLPSPPTGKAKKSVAEKRRDAFERDFDQTPLVIFGVVLLAVMCLGGLSFLVF
jgi:hypothetical protein